MSKFSQWKKTCTLAGLNNLTDEALHRLFIISQKCMVTDGRRKAEKDGKFGGIAGGIVGASVSAPTVIGPVVVTGVGAMAGWMVGMLAGLARGTISCTRDQYPWKEEVDRILASCSLDTNEDLLSAGELE